MVGARGAREVAALVVEAAGRVYPHVRETPLLDSLVLSRATGATVLLKLETLQRTGSFKLRGAVNKLLSLTEAERRAGVVAASSGNHGAAVAHAAQALGIPAIVYVPAGASPVKVAAMERSGAAVRVFGTDGLDTELEARAFASSSGRAYVSPYNDLEVVAGQGTIAVELRHQTARIDAVIASVGGGGLIAGIAADLKAWAPGVRVIGALPANSPVMAASIRAGHVVEMETKPTLSDGTAGGIESGAVTFPLCQALVDDWIEIPEDAIAGAMRHCLEVEHLLVEGSAGVAVAALERAATSLRGQTVVVVLCGANISAARLRDVL